MFAEVSRHQHPHHFDSPLHSPRRYSLHPTSNTLFHNLQQAPTNGSTRLNVGEGRAFQESLQCGPPQYQLQKQAVMQTPRPVSIPAHVDSSEHMLRRKTPNGTLSAAYDGAPVEWASRPHTSKHIILSGPENIGNRTAQIVALNSPQGPVAFSRPSAAIRSDNGPSQVWTRSIASPQFRSGYITAVEEGAMKQQRLQNQYPLDSMLHQAPTNQQIFLGPAGCQQIPTVLQPLWPPSIGPTASNAQSRFGPYWPDGSFEPYRPAPIRDSRFHSQFANINLNGPPEPHATLDPAWSRTYPSFATPRNDEHSNRLLRENSQRRDILPLPQEQIIPLRQSNNPNTLRQMNDVDSATSYVPQGRTTHGKFPGPRSDVFPWPSPPASAQFVPTPNSGKLVPQNCQQFKTKVLLWAHRVYLNLVHQSRRQKQLKQSSEKGHSQSTIYPNPSRHSSTSLRNLAHEKNAQLMVKNGLASSVAPIYRGGGHDGARDSSNNDLRWSHGKSRSSFHERHDRGLRLTGALQPTTQASASKMHHPPSLYQSPSPFPSPIFSPQQVQHPGVEAKAAMDMLDHLCQESGWQWVDGILLGGCLAYGLEQFSLALKWYERVLACDQKYVYSYPEDYHQF